MADYTQLCYLFFTEGALPPRPPHSSSIASSKYSFVGSSSLRESKFVDFPLTSRCVPSRRRHRLVNAPIQRANVFTVPNVSNVKMRIPATNGNPVARQPIPKYCFLFILIFYYLR